MTGNLDGSLEKGRKMKEGRKKEMWRWKTRAALTWPDTGEGENRRGTKETEEKWRTKEIRGRTWTRGREK